MNNLQNSEKDRKFSKSPEILESSLRSSHSVLKAHSSLSTMAMPAALRFPERPAPLLRKALEPACKQSSRHFSSAAALNVLPPSEDSDEEAGFLQIISDIMSGSSHSPVSKRAKTALRATCDDT